MTERETLIKSLRSMPSSLNDACRTMDAAADFIERRSFDTSAAALVWPEPTVTNPDIAAPTGVPYIDSLIHRLLDAQQDINAEANALMSQSLCDASELVDEIEDALRKLTAAVTRPDAPPAVDRNADLQNAFDLGFRAAGGSCYLPPEVEAFFQSWLSESFSSAGSGK